jgi:uncharacterized membrane protein YeiH
MGAVDWFAWYYAAGNIVGISGGFFFSGPCAQLQSMFDKERVFATIAYLGSIILTFVVAIKTESVILTIVCLLIQFFAMVYYMASYLPGARAILRSCAFSLCRCGN